MARITPDQVIALAPDASAVAAAHQVADPAKWDSAGADEAAAWGEAWGSGVRPYQTAVDLKDLAYKCSCPSRKLPCKHALGLLLRFAKGDVPDGEQPGWVQEWLEKRTERSAKQAERASQESAPDPEASEKRAEKRWGNILAGIDECESFLADAVTQGLLAVQSARSWDQMAARMVDAQAPGIAARLKRIGAGIGVGDGWAHGIAGQLGNLALLIEAARRVDFLEDGLKSDVMATLGIPTKKDTLTSDTVIDVWDVLGQIIEAEDRLTTCRTWLRSRSDGKWAMHLTFSAAGQAFDFRPIPGSALAAAVQYYPSAWPMRVNIVESELVPFQPFGGGSVTDSIEVSCQAWERNPWVDCVPMHLTMACLGREGRTWFAIDQEGQSVPLRGSAPIELLARTGNEACDLYGEWNGRSLRLLGAWGVWGYVGL